jgi:hypothetical protein
MSIESLTYADLAGRLGTSHEAARSLVRRLRLPRQLGNDGAVRVNIDLAEIRHHKPLPQRSPRGHRGDFEALKAQVEQLQAQVIKLETEKSSIDAVAVGHRADFERERERSDKLMTNTMTLAAVAMSALAKAARLESELSARRSTFWMKLRTRRVVPASQQSQPNAPPRPQEPIMHFKSVPAAADRVRTFAELAALVMFAALVTVFVEYGIPFLIQ